MDKYQEIDKISKKIVSFDKINTSRNKSVHYYENILFNLSLKRSKYGMLCKDHF